MKKNSFVKDMFISLITAKGVKYVLEHQKNTISDLKNNINTTLQNFKDFIDKYKKINQNKKELDQQIEKLQIFTNDMQTKATHFQFKLKPRLDKIKYLKSNIKTNVDTLSSKIKK